MLSGRLETQVEASARSVRSPHTLANLSVGAVSACTQFTLDSRDGTHVKCGHFNTKGQFKKLDGLSVNNAGLSVSEEE